jgi:putative transposase
MPRKIRIEYAGACYHVINRGNYRRNLFAEEGSAEAFEAVLFEAAARFGWRLHAFVIMRNHFHLALETTEPNLSVGMKWLQGTWAARFNRFHGETGKPFQGRFKALHVEPGHALAQVAHYIHLNPVRARILPAGQLSTFRWSSLHWFPAKNRPAGLEAEAVLGESGGLPDTAAGWRKYVSYLGVLAEEDPRLREAKFGDLTRGWAIGSEAFKTKLAKMLAPDGAETEAFELLDGDAAARDELRSRRWLKLLQQEARRRKIDLTALPASKSAPEKVELAALLKSTTDVSNGWLAEHLSMGQPASVSQFVRRHRMKLSRVKI